MKYGKAVFHKIKERFSLFLANYTKDRLENHGARYDILSSSSKYSKLQNNHRFPGQVQTSNAQL